MKWATQGCPLVVSCPQRQKHETYQGKCVCARVCLLPARGGGKMTIDLEQECQLVLWSESRRCYPQICVVVIYISIHGLLISCWPHQGSLPNLALQQKQGWNHLDSLWCIQLPNLSQAIGPCDKRGFNQPRQKMCFSRPKGCIVLSRVSSESCNLVLQVVQICDKYKYLKGKAILQA